MSETRVVDEHLRIRALDALGPLGDAVAHEALEDGSIEVEHDVRAWEGSNGTVHGHRVVLMLPADLHARAVASHATLDGLSAALAAAMAERSGHAVADVRLEVGVPAAPASSPYRGRQ